MADLVTRLLLDNKQFDSNIIESARQLQHFQKMGKNIVGMLGKFAGTIGLATTATDVFNRYVGATQTLSDSLNNSIGAASDTIDTFFESLRRGDFTAFQQGLNSIYNKMLDIQALRDSLGDAKLSEKYNYSHFSAEFEEQLAIIQDPDSSKKQVDEAVKTSEKLLESYSKKNKATQSGTINTLLAYYKARFPNQNWNEQDLRAYISEYNNDFYDSKNTKNFVTFKEKYNHLKYKAENPEYITDETTGNIIGQKDNSEWVNRFKNFKKKNENSFFMKMYILNTENDKKRGAMLDELEYADDLRKRVASGSKRLARAKNRAVRITNRSSNSKVHSTTDNDTSEEYVKDLTTIAGVDAEIKRLEDERLTANQSQRKELDNQLEVLRLQKEVMDNNLEGTKEAVNMFMELAAKQSGLILSQEESDELDAYMNQTPDVKVKLEPYIDDTETTRERLDREIKELIDEYNKSDNPNKRIQIKVKIKEKQDEKDDNDSKERGRKRAENYIMGYSRALAHGDWSSKEGRQAIGRETIESIKAAIIAETLLSCASLPWPANIIAAPAAAALMSGLFSLIPTFSTGGIFEGNSDYGDMNIARVNAGEMILNNRQQKNLFNLLNGGSIGTNGTSSQVEFKIRGKELVGVLDNYNNKVNRVR